MRDENIGQTEFFLEVEQEIHDLYLRMRVEGRHRLVKEDQLAAARNRPRNADALQLPARELMWEPLRKTLIQFDEPEKPCRLLGIVDLLARLSRTDSDALTDDLTDGEAWIRTRCIVTPFLLRIERRKRTAALAATVLLIQK